MTLHESRSYKNPRHARTPHVHHTVGTNSTTPKYMKRVNELLVETKTVVRFV